MNETKPWWQSKTELLGLAGAVFGAVAFADIIPIIETVVEIALVVVGIGTVILRHYATAKIAPLSTSSS